MINWREKLTSRKFWMAVVGFAAAFMAALGFAPESAERMTALIVAGASVVAYIIGEGLVDASRDIISVEVESELPDDAPDGHDNG